MHVASRWHSAVQKKIEFGKNILASKKGKYILIHLLKKGMVLVTTVMTH